MLGKGWACMGFVRNLGGLKRIHATVVFALDVLFAICRLLLLACRRRTLAGAAVCLLAGQKRDDACVASPVSAEKSHFSSLISSWGFQTLEQQTTMMQEQQTRKWFLQTQSNVSRPLSTAGLQFQTQNASNTTMQPGPKCGQRLAPPEPRTPKQKQPMHKQLCIPCTHPPQERNQ